MFVIIDIKIENLNDIILWIIVGYLVIRTFYYTRLSKSSKDIEYIMISSIVVGFIVSLSFEYTDSIPYINQIKNENIRNIFVVGIIIVTIYILGRFINSELFIELSQKVGILNTPNDIIWNDLIDNKYPNKIIIHASDIIIEGYITDVEPYARLPQVSIASYLIKRDNIIDDNSSCTDKILVYDLSNADYVEIKYYSQSKKCIRIKDACENNKQ